MQNTTPAFPLESIDADALLLVSGGCGGCHHHRGCGPIIINNNNCCAPAGPPAGTVPTAPGPQLAQAAPTDPTVAVTTNVSINGQPVGQAPTATA